MKKFKVGLFFLTFVMILATIGCGAQTPNSASSEAPNKDDGQVQNNLGAPTSKTNPIVTITMENEEQIKVELYPDVAPNTVKSFISLVQKGFYNGLIFHRVIPGFMIQGGDPNGNGSGGPGYSIKGEFTSNGFENNLKHERGVISMGRTQQSKDSAGSQFFIMTTTYPSLDKNYASFGKVISGMETVDKIVNAPATKEKPNQNQVMKSVTVDTLGETYAEPEVIKK